MTNGGYILSSFIGGAISGAIGAGVSQDSDSPILKGAIVTGLINAALGAIIVTAASPPKQLTPGVTGVGHLSSRAFP
jgi:hypothetical protein